MTRVHFSADPSDAGRRVDAALARRAGIPRRAAQEVLESGAVTVAGKSVRPSRRLQAGEVVAGELPSRVSEAPGPEDIPLGVRFSDDRALVVTKPPGLVTHPAGGHESGTLVNALLGLGGSLSGVDPARPGIVHRLDKDTSGLLLVARDDDAHAYFVDAMKRRLIARSYLALVRGVPPARSGTVEAPIGRHPSRRAAMAVVAEGRRAVSHYNVIEAGEEVSLLDVSLETGRTHQIRVHLAHLGHPVLGDRAYGGASELAARLGLTRPFLHAWRLAFPHPDDGRRVAVTDTVPADLAAALEAAGIEQPASPM
jgi:23S rRNA pseudouridine1911/1915/1917 synthase